MADTLFHMWSRFRDKLIGEHKFYIEQAQKRLLSQFENIEEEAEKHANDWLGEVSHHFDPENHDPSDFYEQAREEMFELHQMLSEMHNRTCLSVVAGMFHEWEKQLKSWILKEVNRWHSGEYLKMAICKASFIQLIELLEASSVNIQGKSYYKSLDRCRLVVNVYKHGGGNSFEDIKKLYPEFIGGIEDRRDSFIDYVDHTFLIIEDSHIAEFSNAIIEFWKDVPEYILNNNQINIPIWFQKAYQKDADQIQKSKEVQS